MRVLTGLAAGAVALTIGLSCLAIANPHSAAAEAVTADQALTLLEKARSDAAALDLSTGSGAGRRYCARWADDQSMCLRSVRQISPWTPHGEFRVISVNDRPEDTVILTVHGRYAHSHRWYRSQVQVIEGEDGEPTFVDPVFWRPRSVAH